MTTETETNQTNAPIEAGNQPDWIVKSPRGYGKNSYLDRVGVAWNREDGGIGIRLAGKQIIEDDLYLYPNTPKNEQA